MQGHSKIVSFIVFLLSCDPVCSHSRHCPLNHLFYVQYNDSSVPLPSLQPPWNFGTYSFVRLTYCIFVTAILLLLITITLMFNCTKYLDFFLLRSVSVTVPSKSLFSPLLTQLTRIYPHTHAQTHISAHTHTHTHMPVQLLNPQIGMLAAPAGTLGEGRSSG